MPCHKFLGEILTALQPGPVFAGPHEQQVSLHIRTGLQKILKSFYQRIFRTAYHHIYVFFHHCPADKIKIRHLTLYSFRYGVNSRITGQCVEISQHGTLSYLPGKGMFPAARAEQQYIVLHISFIIISVYIASRPC